MEKARAELEAAQKKKEKELEREKEKARARARQAARTAHTWYPARDNNPCRRNAPTPAPTPATTNASATPAPAATNDRAELMEVDSLELEEINLRREGMTPS